MGELVMLFTLKLLDTAIGALKNIFLIKNKSFLSAFANAVSYLFYILMMKQLMSTTNVSTIGVTLVAVFLGQYITQNISNKLDKETVWKVSITSTTLEEGQSIADELKEYNIPVRTYPCYNDEIDKVLGIDVFSSTKTQSAIINDILGEYKDVKFNIVEIRNRF